MKNILLILMIILFANFSDAQTNYYSNLWNKVETLEKEGLPKSALKIIENIDIKAKKDNNTNQQIKVLLFKSKFALTLEEDAQLKIINDFKTSILLSEAPTKNLLESMLANLYWQYFNRHRWQFYNRTKTQNKIDTEDFRTWDLQTLFNEIHFHFQNSLQNGLILQQTKLVDYDQLLTLQNQSKLYRPTLFDLLANTALEFYKTSENNITKPAYKFKIDNPFFLSEALTFSSVNISSEDQSSLQLNALKLYQRLVKFHLNDKEPYALADIDIQRLLYIKQNAAFTNKDTLLLETLKAQSDKLAFHEASGLYDFEIATLYYQKGQSFLPKTNEKYRCKLKDAFELCATIISKFPKSKAAEKAKVLQQQILQSSLQITTETFLPIQQNARLLISYKNLEQLNFKVYKISRNQLTKFNKTYRKEDQLVFIKNLNVVTQWQSILRNEQDYQKHSTEILFPKLNNGTYIIFASPKKNDESTFAFSSVQITNMALVEQEDNNYQIYQLINRNNGKPLVGAKINFSFKKNYNKATQHKQYITNSNGEFQIKKLTNSRFQNVKIEVNFNNEKAYYGNYYIYQKNRNIKAKAYTGFLFTDRSIYRPGQTVYFKGIAIKRKNGASEVDANEKLTVTLKDANYQVVKTLDFTTNDFGSFNGEFIIPNNGLTGNYNLNISCKRVHLNGNANILVEEYKRPKFETKFNSITETFKINDSITIKGNALAYSGSNITDAKVVYRVHRKVQYPKWYYWYRPRNSFFSESQEITHGRTFTNDKGEFEITFKALPDESVDKTDLPIFNYEITADVTDINGETRTATTTVKVGYHALLANLIIDAKIDKTIKIHKINIETKNLNGESASAKGSIKIYKLQAPQEVLRPRPWISPDFQEFSRNEFKKLFPNEAYTNEHDSNNWEKGLLVLDKSFDTNISKELTLGSIKKWDSGKYIILLESKDKFGQVVKDETKIELFNTADESPSDNQLFTISTQQKTYQPNETVFLTLGTSAKNTTVTVSVEKENSIISTFIVSLENETKTLKTPVTKNDLGGFIIHYSYAAFNSYHSGSKTISVPYPKTDLEIETATFRDKLQPGQEETWSFKIKGPKGDKVSAELLASMYDASLDQFTPHNWNFNPISNPIYYSYNKKNGRSFGISRFRIQQARFSKLYYSHQAYDKLNWFGLHLGNSNIRIVLRGMVSGIAIVEDEMEIEESVMMMKSESNLEEIIVVDNYSGLLNLNSVSNDNTVEKKNQDFNNIQIRKNLQETAFFFPNLKTDANGNVSFSFTTPEALTAWKLQLLAHTKTLESTISTLETVTQKELMVTPNAPRFLREGDRISISTKIANLTSNALSGQAKLILTDAITNKDITEKLLKDITLEKMPEGKSVQKFSVNAKGNTQVSWSLNIPNDVQAVQYKIIAKAGNFSDGEQNILPVLTNRILVTETLPMWIRSNQTKTFTLDKLKNTTSTTRINHKLTLEITSNPAWYAVQSLPYLMEYPYECNEQIFSRYYANTLASHIANSNPRIQEVFNQWAYQDVLVSNLEKNQELKSILIQETPWLRDAQSETEQKKRIALLFNLNKMNNELKMAKRKLKNNQMNSGASSWFKGGRENRYITQHIITGFGHLKQLNVTLNNSEESMIKKAINYLDAEFVKEYKYIRKYNTKVDLSKDHLSYTQLHYLYMRSFYSEIKKSKQVEEITTYYHTQIKKYWLKRTLYAKGLMALVTYRIEDKMTSSKILKSLKENSITSEELGMYWKTNTNSWYWYQAPIETQALLIEAFSEIENDTATIDNLKIWLLKNKQTNSWKTTKATTDAIYALLLQRGDWLSVTEAVDVVIGGNPISPTKLENVKIEAGTGYYKTAWYTSEITPKMAKVTLTKKGNGIPWGSLYWQYFEDLDKITSAETPLKLKKKLFLKTNTDKGEELFEITKSTPLKVGDLIRVRIELRSDRAMEFVHMKDMRAAGLEPVNVLSQYKWQDGLGYYESTKDASTNFFFDYLPKGIYVFEYDLRVNNAGNMSNGITTIQSMYAPEFSSHSEGTRILVDGN